MKHRVFLCCVAAMMTVSSAGVVADDRIKTATPIKHLVVFFQENVSFDHYFGAYPNALNDDGIDSSSGLLARGVVRGALRRGAAQRGDRNRRSASDRPGSPWPGRRRRTIADPVNPADRAAFAQYRA